MAAFEHRASVGKHTIVANRGWRLRFATIERLPSENTWFRIVVIATGFHTVARDLGGVVQAVRRAGDSSPSQSRARGKRRSRALSTIVTINNVSPNSGI